MSVQRIFQKMLWNSILKVCSQLVSSLISQHLNDNNNSVVGALSAQLRQICPDFYSPDDLACTQVIYLSVLYLNKILFYKQLFSDCWLFFGLS